MLVSKSQLRSLKVTSPWISTKELAFAVACSKLDGCESASKWEASHPFVCLECFYDETLKLMAGFLQVLAGGSLCGVLLGFISLPWLPRCFGIFQILPQICFSMKFGV